MIDVNYLGDINVSGTAEADPYLNKAQVARRLKVSLRSVDNLMRRGTLPYHKLGRLVRFRALDVDTHLAKTCRVCNGSESFGTQKV